MPLTLGRILERRMQIVDHLQEAIARILLAIFSEYEELDAPFSHGKLLDRRLVWATVAKSVPLLHTHRRDAEQLTESPAL